MPTPTRERDAADRPSVRPQPVFRREALAASTLDLAELYHANTKFHAALLPLEDDPLASDDGPVPDATSLQYVPLDDPRRVLLPDRWPDEVPVSPLHEVVSARRSRRQFSGASVDLASLGALLHLTYGVTGRLESLEGEHGRAAPSAGGRYPLELFVAARRVDGLTPGWYHVHPETHTLEPVRDHDPGPDLDRAFFRQPLLENAAFVLVVGAVLSRTMARYGERGYRLVLLDAGHAGAHANLAATALGLGACGLGGFLDDDLHEVLKLGGVDEVALYAVAVGVPDGAR